MYCEGVKGECNLGQQEIAFRYDTALVTCDNHSIYKSGAKMIADKHGKSLTFMAKFNEREGNSCHIHISFRDTKGNAVFSDKNADRGMSDMFRHFLAGQIALMREFTLLYAPNINSYKRYAEGSFAPTAIAWGADNRTLALRVVGHGHGMRVEHRVPGGDVNQYLAVAGLIAAGMYGIENKLELEEITLGNGYESDKPHVPTSLREAGAAEPLERRLESLAAAWPDLRAVLAGPASARSVVDGSQAARFKQEGLERMVGYDAGRRKSLIDHFWDVDVAADLGGQGDGAAEADRVGRVGPDELPGIALGEPRLRRLALPAGERVVERDLAKNPLPHLSEPTMGAYFTPPEQRSGRRNRPAGQGSGAGRKSRRRRATEEGGRRPRIGGRAGARHAPRGWRACLDRCQAASLDALARRSHAARVCSIRSARVT